MIGAIAGPGRDFPMRTPLIELFDQQVAADPAHDALVIPRPDGTVERVSYAELAARESRLTERLTEFGPMTGRPVLVRLHRGPQAVVALLSCLRAGAAYVPLDAALPQSVVDIAIEDTGAVIELTDTEPVPRRIEHSHPEAELPGVALVLYTSGTTGRPKAVLHSETQLRNRMHWLWHDYPWQPGEIASQRSPLAVIPSIGETLAGLLCGVPTVLIPDPVVKDTDLFLDELAAQRVSRLTVTPSLLRLMLDDPRRMRASRGRLAVVNVLGEPCPPDLAWRFHQDLPDATLVNEYGCTELNTITQSTWTPHVLEHAMSGDLPGGRPIANLTVWLLDDTLHPVPEGAVGEVCVQGPALALGYLNRADQTAAKFVDGPDGQRMYRTGDLGRAAADGTVVLLGRTDNQLKINGRRVEPEGVEFVLTEHPSVREALVGVRALASTGHQLHAWLVPETGRDIDLDALRAALADRLPAHAVPAGYQIVAELPRTPRGKLDRRAPAVADGRAARLRDELRELLACRVLDVDPSEVDTERDFHLLGVDSLLAVRFVRLVNQHCAAGLGVADLFDKPNLTALAAHLASGESTRLPAAESTADRGGQVAVIGYAGRFATADDPDELWDLVVHGREAVHEVPRDRWDTDRVFGSVSRSGGFLPDAAGFEPLFFGIAPAEAPLLDPQQRQGLQEAWRALEHAGYAPDRLAGARVGVFVGARKGDYGNHLRDRDVDHGAAMLGGDPALIAARIAYHLDLHGPCLTVDTACSSSLTALHLARQSLLSGECDLALVGGTCVITDPHYYVSTSRLGIFSPTGHTRPFDDGADGFVQGEGAVFVVLRLLPDALAGRDTVHGVLVATGINQDGRTNGIGAPSATAQADLVTELYRRHDIDPAAIGYVEAHGTGTKVGDPIEAAALTTAFRRFTPAEGYCALGSVKANTGHLAAAAGLAGLVKLLLCLRHRTIPPLATLVAGNEHLDLDHSPFYLPTMAARWARPAGGTRLAALSSFGLGGSNAHCVLAEPPAAPDDGARRPAYLVVLSARTEASLRRMCARMLTRLTDSLDSPPPLRDLSFTLLAGRRWFPLRQVFVVADHAELAAALREVRPEGPAPVPPTAEDEALGRALLADLAGYDGGPEDRADEYRATLDALAALVRRSFRPEPTALSGADRPARVPLPSYPFDLERHWHDTVAAEHVTGEHGSVAEIVIDAVGELLGLPADVLDPSADLDSYGMDSIKAVALKQRLDYRLGVAVPMAVIGTSLTAADLVESLAGAVDPLLLPFLTGARSLDEADGAVLNRLFEVCEGKVRA